MARTAKYIHVSALRAASSVGTYQGTVRKQPHIMDGKIRKKG